jgi:hypothetical protein
LEMGKTCVQIDLLLPCWTNDFAGLFPSLLQGRDLRFERIRKTSVGAGENITFRCAKDFERVDILFER